MVQKVSAQVEFRDGTRLLFALLSKQKVPLLVFSAGIGNVIEELLVNKRLAGVSTSSNKDADADVEQKHAEQESNVHVVSNFLRFHKQTGHAVGFQGECIHVFNKNEGSAASYYDSLQRRKYVLLLGDSLGDANMCDGLPHDEVIRIGFLNRGHGKSVNALLPLYQQRFDVVIVGKEQSFDEALQIISSML
jgi:5'-nucleotidase